MKTFKILKMTDAYFKQFDQPAVSGCYNFKRIKVRQYNNRNRIYALIKYNLYFIMKKTCNNNAFVLIYDEFCLFVKVIIK